MSRGWDIFDVSCIIAHIDEERCSLDFCHYHVVGIKCISRYRKISGVNEAVKPNVVARPRVLCCVSTAESYPGARRYIGALPLQLRLTESGKAARLKVGPNFHECVFWKKPHSKLTVCALFILQAKAVQIALLKFGLHWLEVHEMPGPIIAPAFWCFTENTTLT
jgi:hypothetical protein